MLRCVARAALQDQDTHSLRCQECWPLVSQGSIPPRNCSWLKKPSFPLSYMTSHRWVIFNGW